MCNKINITPKLAIEGEDRTLGAVLLGAPYSRKREMVMLPMIQQDIQSKPLMGVAVFDADGIPTQATARCAREVGRPMSCWTHGWKGAPFSILWLEMKTRSSKTCASLSASTCLTCRPACGTQ